MTLNYLDCEGFIMTEEYIQYAYQLKNQKLIETEELYQTQLNAYISVFKSSFKEICSTVIRLQQDGELDEIAYLEYTFLYTNLIQKQEKAEVRVYGKDWYLDASQRAVGDFDYSFLFTKYMELWEGLMEGRKRFAGAVTAREVTTFLLECARPFFQYAVSAFRFSIPSCICDSPFRSIRRAQEFEINIGEYMAHTEAVYKENRTRTREGTLEWFRLRHGLEYAFEGFQGLDLSGADLAGIDLRYADLSNANLSGANIQDAMLIGARFCHADMEGACLRGCLLHEADFTGANLAKACFQSAESCRGMPQQGQWVITGYRSARFRDANLSGADFSRSGILDADFTGAIMDGAIIPKSQLASFALSEDQRMAVHASDG